MTPPLFQQRCFNHALREAAARCPECGHCFCRECITEHDDRVLCAGCLRHQAEARSGRGRGVLSLARGSAWVTGLFLSWFFFYWLGQGLLALPSSFHDATVWKSGWLEEPPP